MLFFSLSIGSAASALLHIWSVQLLHQECFTRGCTTLHADKTLPLRWQRAPSVYPAFCEPFQKFSSAFLDAKTNHLTSLWFSPKYLWVWSSVAAGFSKVLSGFIGVSCELRVTFAKLCCQNQGLKAALASLLVTCLKSESIKGVMSVFLIYQSFWCCTILLGVWCPSSTAPLISLPPPCRLHIALTPRTPYKICRKLCFKI